MRIILFICLSVTCIAYAEFQQGFYAGLRAGWSHLDSSQTGKERSGTPTYFPISPADDMGGKNFNKNVITPDIFFGYRHRTTHQPWTIAVEVSLLFGKMTAQINTQNPRYPNYVVSILQRNSSGAIHLKPGYLLSEKFIVFGIVGVCLDRYKWEYLEHIDNGDFWRNDKKLLPGFIFGLGAEQALHRIHIGVEVTYTFYNRKTFEGGLSWPNYDIKMKVNPHILRAALYISYVF